MSLQSNHELHIFHLLHLLLQYYLTEVTYAITRSSFTTIDTGPGYGHQQSYSMLVMFAQYI